MATIDYWAEVPLDRGQISLFSPTLDSVISDDDPVRLFDEVLSGVDWSKWEAKYHGGRGQPPVHPRYIAAAILYGLYRSIRSSRQLEQATHYRLDFIWLLHGRQLDHTTLSKFRSKFPEQLKDFFRQIGRIAMTLGLVRLCDVAFDGTRVKANNARHATMTAKTLKDKLTALDELFEMKMAELTANDSPQKSFDAATDGASKLPTPLAKLDRRRQQVREAFARAQASDEARRKLGRNPTEHPVQVPTTDSDARVMPNKEGGYAPNYTPTATTDGHSGFIVDCDVTNDVNEGSLAAVSVDHIEEAFGDKPKRFLTDGGNNSGPLMEQMEQRKVEFFAPVQSSKPQQGNPALRDDPKEPVAEAEWPLLPRNKQGQLEKTCFVYDARHDVYYCPQGQPMHHEKSKVDKRGHEPTARRIYRCTTCGGCPLASACLSKTTKRGRTITRDRYEEARERTVDRMQLESSQQLLRRRSWIAETPFAVLKNVMGIRQFLLRGAEKVRTEWRWAVTCYNLSKLVRALKRLRSQYASLWTHALS